MAARKKTSRVPVTTSPKQDMDRDWTDRTKLEDALIEVIEAQTARRLRPARSGASDERTNRLLRADAEIMRAILRRRQELVALMEEEVSALDGPGE